MNVWVVTVEDADYHDSIWLTENLAYERALAMAQEHARHMEVIGAWRHARVKENMTHQFVTVDGCNEISWKRWKHVKSFLIVKDIVKGSAVDALAKVVTE